MSGPEPQEPTQQVTAEQAFGSPDLERLLALAIDEDLRQEGDVTSRLIPADRGCRGEVIFREAGVLAGLPLAERVLARVAPDARLEPRARDGELIAARQVVATVSGPARQVLAAERTLLNFLQRLSGVATATRRFVERIEGSGARLLDTRKTTPGWRLLEKYAVRMGGGTNHRLGLWDQVLIKDNHLAALGGERTVAAAVAQARSCAPPGTPIEVEVTTLDGALEAARAGAEIVLLDNFTPARLREAVTRVREDAAGRRAAPPLLEASGGITLDTVRDFAATGVDRISTGAVTHSVRNLDIALDLEIAGDA